MENLLLRTQLAFDNCQEHLNVSNAWGSEIESYLTQHILVIMCADVQQEIYGVVERRADIADDIALKNYAVATCKKVLRSIGKGEVAGFVGHFGREAKEYLNNNIDDKDVTIYNNAVSGRHDVAHSTGVNVTFRELEEAIRAARKLITVVSESISLNTAAA
ncbi:hypothetical protein A9Q88_00915 [Gammaproteobacteria bacterium 50_400_T64]|nr:hypothetical protein A9Q88_00915 [Gammaproteobacteria bacterium 50_400_T64]